MPSELSSEELQAEAGDLLPRRETLGSLVSIGDITVGTAIAVNTGLAMNVLSVGGYASVWSWQQPEIL